MIITLPIPGFVSVVGLAFFGDFVTGCSADFCHIWLLKSVDQIIRKNSDTLPPKIYNQSKKLLTRRSSSGYP